MEKITKEELKQPDGFIKTLDQVLNILKPGRHLVLVGFALLIFGGFCWAVWDWYSDSKENQAQNELFLITHRMEKKVADLDEKYQKEHPAKPTGKKAAAKGDEETPVLEARPKNLEQDLAGEVKELNQFIQQKTGTRASLLAAIELSNTYREYGEVDKAIEVLEKVSARPKSGDLLAATIHMKLGDYKQTKGECAQAITHWENVASANGFEPLKPEALLRQGLCYETLNKTDKALEIYQTLGREYKDSRAGRESKKFIRGLQTKS